MKFSEQWLREWVNPDLSTVELIEQLTMAGLEVDGTEPVASEFSKVVIAEVIAVNPHPDADKLRVCTVNAGDTEPVQIVCGAPNVVAGGKYPLARVGGKLGDMKIKKAKLRGMESFGMLCSESELGISENHDGLMTLPVDAPVGESVRDFLKLDDVIVDLDLTPNRSDCLSIIGLARETGVLNNLDVVESGATRVSATIDDTFPVRLKAQSACPRYVGRVIKNINLNAQSPLWLQEKLRRADVRSIDPIVDVTNYVMLELGQPLHAFDYDTLQEEIVVRLSTPGEKVTLLDNSDVELSDDTLLITDASGVIAIAGVMGGLSTAVTNKTTSIFLESAFFAPIYMAGKARSYGMHTEASHRFERGVDWQLQVRAIERATELLLEIVGGEPGPVDETLTASSLPTANEVTLRASRIKRVLGVDISDEQVGQMLSRLDFEFGVSSDADDTSWAVLSPSHRFDIAIEADLIEEISRIYGYDNLPVTVPQSGLVMPAIPEGTLTVNVLKDQLVSRGYQEAITYSFVDSAQLNVIDPENEPIALQNPISQDMDVMRTTLWAGLLKSVMYNKNRQQDRVRLFEVGLRFIQPVNQPEFDLAEVRQEKMLAGVACGTRHSENWANASDLIDFFDIKGDLETLLTLSGAEYTFEAGQHPALHPGQTAQIMRDGQLVGYVGLLDPRTQQQLDIEDPIYLFELKTDLLITRDVYEFQELSRFPEARRDIAILVDREVRASAIFQCVRGAASSALINLKLFDVYEGKGIDPTRKSIALGLTFQDPSRNLTDTEIALAVDKIVGELERQLGANLR